MNSHNAHYAVLTLESPGFLLGGTRRHESSAFAAQSDAESWAVQAKEVNIARPGYADAKITMTIVSCYSRRPIPAQSIQ
jgi:hypothetical protein